MGGELFAGGKNVFDRPQGIFKFALTTAIGAAISPVFGVTSLALDGFADWRNYGAIWITWWLGDRRPPCVSLPIDAHQAVSNVVEICRAETRPKKLNVRLNLRAKSCQVTADPAKFQQIIWNLLKNAIKFTPEGGDITIFSDNPSEGVFTVSVRDTGIGMEPEVMQRIFDHFGQGNRSLEHRFVGLGLDLASSKSLAQAHGGTLTAQSDESNRG